MDRCGPRVRNINVCHDAEDCSEAMTNSISLGEKLDPLFHIYSNVIHKVKIGVSGCRKDCTMCRILTDIGFIGIGEGSFDVYVGGRLGVNPMAGIKMAEFLPEEECVTFTLNYFELLKSYGRGRERSADLINRLGVEKVKEELTKNLKRGFTHKPTKCKTAAPMENREILRIRATCGEVTSQQARKIAFLAEKYGKGLIHFAVRGSPEIPGVDKKDLPAVERELERAGLMPLTDGYDNLQTCYGDYCTNSIMNTQSILRKIERKVVGSSLKNLNIKISASGCANSCGIAHLSDIGFLGVTQPEVDITKCKKVCDLCLRVCKRNAIQKENEIAVINKEKCKYCGECIRSCPFDAIFEKRKGYAILVRGKGEESRLGEVIAEFLSEEEALDITERYLKEKYGLQKLEV